MKHLISIKCLTSCNNGTLAINNIFFLTQSKRIIRCSNKVMGIIELVLHWATVKILRVRFVTVDCFTSTRYICDQQLAWGVKPFSSVASVLAEAQHTTPHSHSYMCKQHPHVQTFMRVSLDLSTSQTTYNNYGAFSFWPISSLIIITSQMASHKAS